MISQHEKRRQVWRPQTKMTCHRLPIELSLIASLPLRAKLFCEKPGKSRGLDRTKSPSTGFVWRFHDPPNLDLQYQCAEKSCQGKNAKCGRVFHDVPISCGAYSKNCTAIAPTVL